MIGKTPASVTISGDLYDNLRKALTDPAALHQNGCTIREAHSDEDHLFRLAAELASVIEDDWCEDDGDGYCGNHDAWIVYTVDNFGPNGKVLKPGTFTDDDVAFPVCSSSNRYDPDLA